jgi:hypothetical protein
MEASGFSEQLRRLANQAAFQVGHQFHQHLGEAFTMGQQWRLACPSLPTWAQSIELSLAPAMRRIRELLRELARAGAGLAQDFALLALVKASEVREAVLRGDRPAVVRFIAEWLGWSPTEERVEAVSMALLESCWDGVVATDSCATERAWRAFRARALKQHRVQRARLGDPGERHADRLARPAGAAARTL